MNGFRVIAIPDELAREVRARGVDPVYGHPAHAETADPAVESPADA